MFFIFINILVNKVEFDIYSLENDTKRDILQDEIIIPRSFDIGGKLNYIRKIMDILIKQYDVRKAYIYTEEYLDEEIIDIIKIEGVIEELFSNCGVEICK